MLSSPEDHAGVDPRGAVVTTKSDGVELAMTVDSPTSLLLEPMWGAEKIVKFHSAVLSAGQRAEKIASQGRRPADQRVGVKHSAMPVTGARVLGDAVGVLECRTRGVYDGGDHSIGLGEVLAASVPPGPALPSLHDEGPYRRLEGGNS